MLKLPALGVTTALVLACGLIAHASAHGQTYPGQFPANTIACNPSAGSAAPLQPCNYSIVNVKDRGAKGDGVTDDYPVINTAVGAVAAAGGGTLYFPPGTYAMSSALVPVSGVNIQGAGPAATIIKNTATGPPPFNMGLLISASFTGGNHLDNPTGTAITYPINAPTEGANTITTTAAADAGNFAAGQIVLISGDTHATNFWYPDWSTTVVSAVAGTGVITLSENLPFGGATITRVQRLLTQPQNIKVSDLTILGTNNQSLQVTAAQNITFDNIIVRAGFGGTTGASVGFSACRNCAWQNSVSYGVFLDMLGCFDSRFVNDTVNGGTIQFDGGTQNSLISGNSINNPVDGNGAGFHGVSLAVYTRRNRVVGNAIANVPANFSGVFSIGSVAGDGNQIIEGNTVTGANTTGTVGVSINNSVNNTVAANWLNNLAVGVAAANNATGQTVDANTLVGVTTPYSIDATSSVRAPFLIGPFAIASLPACNAGIAGGRAIVNNGVASPTYQGAVSTTGAATQPVFCNGTGWIYD